MSSLWEEYEKRPDLREEYEKRPDLREDVPELGPDPANHPASNKVRDPAIAAVDSGDAGHVRFQEEVVILELAADNDHLLAIDGLRHWSDKVHTPLQIHSREAARLHEYGIARADVAHFLFRNLHLDDDACHIDDPGQLIARTEMLVQLPFHKRRGDDTVDGRPDFRFRELLIENRYFIRQPAHVRFDLADLFGTVARLRQLKIALRLRKLPRFQIRLPVGCFR